MLEIRYVWEWPVRITHWVNFICLAVLSVTGYFIGEPFIGANTTSAYIMGWFRFLHFVFGYLLAASVVSRLIWMFIGNRYATWRNFVPWISARGRQGARKMFKYYTFIDSRIPYEVGHNALAGSTYAVIFLLFLVQIVTGFTLYGQFAPGEFWDVVFGWLPTIFATQWMRFTHHIVMWLLIGFVIHHIYSAWLMDVKERNGVMSSIFGGCKYIEPADVDRYGRE